MLQKHTISKLKHLFHKAEMISKHYANAIAHRYKFLSYTAFNVSLGDWCEN